MPHLDYVYHVGPAANCAPLLAGVAPAAGNRAPNLPLLAGLAGGALPGIGGMGGAGLGAVGALAGCVPYTWPALTNACLAVGLYPPGMHPLYEATWRIANLRMASYTALGHLRRTPLLGNLETQERIHLSYFMGMNLSAYAARAAGLTFPMHFSRFSTVNGGLGVAYTENAVFAIAGIGLPDLVFVDAANGTCQIWEAKGRGGDAAAGGFPAGGVPAVLNGSMSQARRVATALVGGALIAPNARIVSVSRLDAASTNWFLHVSDPADGGQKRVLEDDSMPKEQFYREFYRPYVEMMSESQETVQFGGITYLVAGVPGTSTKVGLDQRIHQILTQSPAKRRRIEGQDEARPPDDVAGAIEHYIAQGYPQDNGNADRYVSPEGVLTEGAEEDITQPPP
jgi:hypothetical protein